MPPTRPSNDSEWVKCGQRRIAILAPLVEPVPPPLYGGTDRVVSLLTEELVRRGHQVALFAYVATHTAIGW